MGKILTGGNGIKYLFTYAYSFLLPFVQTENNILYSSMLSLFPIPIVMGILYLYKKEKHGSFLIPLLIALVLETLWCIVGFPQTIGKITLFNLVSVEGSAIAVALGCIYLYMYIISNIDEKFISIKDTIKIVLIMLVLFFCIDRPDVLETSKMYMYLFSSVLAMAYFLILNSTEKQYRKLFFILIIFWTFLSSIFVGL